MKSEKKITASSRYKILGTYEGETLDTNITNKNGLDITREVMETVFSSEDYRQGIENGWFIGFLGHPEDPNCMEFEHGCIVMTDGYIDNNGKVYGKFNLIDTPVGQIVKKFQDAGVIFGISIRGAGDIVNNSVQPDTFVFRGFDLVSFPAYPESIPKFTAIVASTSLEDQKKYQSVCTAVNENLKNITSCSTIDILKSQFAPQSEEYKSLENQRQKILSGKTFNIDKEKVEAMTELYLKASAEADKYAKQIEQLKHKNAITISACNRKVAALKRITDSQIGGISRSLDSVTASCDTLREKNKKLTERLNGAQKTNLLYKKKIESGIDEIKDRETIIAGLQKELHETVTASSKMKSRSSDLGDENKRLRSEMRIYKNALRSFQTAYAGIYASALGINSESISFGDSTSVSELQNMISSAANTINLPSTVTVEPMDIDGEYNDLITL